MSSLQNFLFLLLELLGEAFQIFNAMLIFEVLFKEQEHIVAHAHEEQMLGFGEFAFSPRLLLPEFVFGLIKDFFDIPSQSVEPCDEARRKGSLVRKW